MSVSILPINVGNLLHCRGVESQRVEFKASWNPTSTGPQALRTICAFANDYHNLNGGYVVIGVEERDGRGILPPVGLSARQVEAAQKWIRGNCNRLDPPYQPILSPERLEDRLVLVVWAPASDMRPHRAPAAAGKAARYWIRLGNETVDAEGHRRGDLLRGLIEQTARLPWDDRVTRAARVDDMRERKVREFLHAVRSGLLNEPDERELFRRMRLLTRINDHEVPRNIGLLFFSNDPTEWFRGAKIEVVQFAAGRAGDVQEERTFGGSLLDQARDCLAYLENLSVSHLQKQRNDIRAKTWVAYPMAALREALINALYHRSYDLDQPEPTKVYIFPSRIEIISYPGPVPGIQSAHLLPNAKVIRAAPARNRRIGEFLKELGLAEGRLSGLPKIYVEMAANGSPKPSFDFDEQRTYFQATFPAHPQYAAISAVRDAAHLRALGNRQDAYRRLQTELATDRSSPAAPAMLHEMAAMRTSRDGNSNSEPDPLLAWGVDGCPAGWFYIALDATGEWCCGLVGSLREIVELASKRDRVFVDIPIGLPDERNPDPRQCDLEARRLLNRDRRGTLLPVGKRRGTSVFPAPARETLDAKDYPDACAINQMVTGKKVAKQIFAIFNKIRDANQLLRDNASARAIVSEVHPELCFWGLNDRHPMQHNKKQLPGRNERLAVLQSCWPQAKSSWDEICSLYRRNEVAYDDITDAMVAAVIARANLLNRFPEEPPRDAKDLPMQMIWASREMVGGSMRMKGLAELIPEGLKGEQGRVFYSGRSAFEKPSHLYILGFNPAGSWEGTISKHTNWILKEAPHSWSSYEEKGAKSKMRPRMLHLFEKLSIAPGKVPASNLIFKSSPRASGLKNPKQLAEACWPFHQAVIDDLDVSVVLCLGGDSGKWVRRRLNTSREEVDCFEEKNNRKWKSYVHKNDDGLKVVTLTHPSIANWTSPASDPTHLVFKAIRGDYD